ncbi:anks1b [Symbiodinium pilosum]|uniref:Anks1b protein n=1 Tax=Symbiodinium pilosum TaxID=2952 RepID=A0A812SA08_SYMPI|nr:anks1b [Symbiodinium pilosum]
MTVLKRHEALKEEGLVVQFDESMGKAIFVSHQWLSKEHPDPSMTQLKVLQDYVADGADLICSLWLP